MRVGRSKRDVSSEHARIKRELALLGVRPRKSRGQSFLADRQALATILTFYSIPDQCPLLEIGPGLGALTEELVRRNSNLIVVELEQAFAAALIKKGLLREDQVRICDIRNVVFYDGERDAHTAGGSHGGNILVSPSKGVRWTIIGNVPYSISTEIILWIFKNRKSIQRASLMLQREYAERLCADPGSRSYSSLSVLRMLYANARIGPIVSGKCFYPAVEVESALIELSMREQPLHQIENIGRFETIVRACFAARRKTLLNCLSRGAIFSDKDQARQCLEQINLAPMVRAEALTLDDFVRLYRAISAKEAAATTSLAKPEGRQVN